MVVVIPTRVKVEVVDFVVAVVGAAALSHPIVVVVSGLQGHQFVESRDQQKLDVAVDNWNSNNEISPKLRIYGRERQDLTFQMSSLNVR